MAQVCGLEAGTFVHTLGDAHLYMNHLDQAREQISREPLTLPVLKLDQSIADIDAFTFEHIEIIGMNIIHTSPLLSRPDCHDAEDDSAMDLDGCALEKKTVSLGVYSPTCFRFKRLTVGQGNSAVLMGRTTWETIPERFRPLTD